MVIYMNLEKLEDIVNINSLLVDTKVEGNCMYKHYSDFELRGGKDHDSLRYNLGVLGKMSQKILEIGFNAGHSAALLLNNDNPAKFVAMDLGRHDYTSICVEYLQTKYDLEYIEGNSNKTLPKYNPGIIFDLIHIDGGHGIVTATNDVNNCKKLSNADTLLVVDDTNFKRIRDLLDKLCQDKLLQEVDYDSLGLKQTKYHRVFRYL